MKQLEEKKFFFSLPIKQPPWSKVGNCFVSERYDCSNCNISRESWGMPPVEILLKWCFSSVGDLGLLWNWEEREKKIFFFSFPTHFPHFFDNLKHIYTIMVPRAKAGYYVKISKLPLLARAEYGTKKKPNRTENPNW